MTQRKKKINYIPTAIDLFAGAGGLSEALKEVGFNILGAIEYEKVFADTYIQNHGDHVLVEDISKVKCKSFAKKFNIPRKNLDLLAGCSPCQGFSKQYKYRKNKNGLSNEPSSNIVKEDPRNKLVFHYVKFVHYFQPKYIFFENVPGILSHQNIFNAFIEKLTSPSKNFPGYSIEYQTVDTADYGVPQRRKRFVLIGKRLDLMNSEHKQSIFPKPTHGDPTKTHIEGRKPWVVLRKVISHLPAIEAGQTHKQDILHFSKNISDQNKVRLNHTPHNGGSRKDWPDFLWLDCHKGEKSKVGYGDVYGRMDYDKVAPTLTGGCLSITKGRFAHPEQNRAISAREAALIQTFPPDYIFKGTKEKIALQIGNAVPVTFGKTFIKNILNDLQESTASL